MKSKFVVISALAISSSAGAAVEPKASSCYSGKEFVTAHRFFKGTKELNANAEQSRQWAERAALGCDGAASRLIKTTMVLLKAGLTGKDAVEYGLKLAQASQTHADAFIAIFKTAYAEDGLDLDLPASLKLASRFSFEFTGDVAVAHKDFDQLVSFCMTKKGLDLPRPQCGDLAARLATRSDQLVDGVRKPFIQLYEFLRSEGASTVSTAAALQIAEEVAPSSAEASENFITSFKYARNSDGLDMTVDQAVTFAKRIALRK